MTDQKPAPSSSSCQNTGCSRRNSAKRAWGTAGTNRSGSTRFTFARSIRYPSSELERAGSVLDARRAVLEHVSVLQFTPIAGGVPRRLFPAPDAHLPPDAHLTPD